MSHGSEPGCGHRQAGGLFGLLELVQAVDQGRGERVARAVVRIRDRGTGEREQQFPGPQAGSRQAK